MKRTLIILAALAAVSACGGSASSTTTTPAAGSPSAAAGSPSGGAAGSPSAASSPLDPTTQREICNDLEAMVITGGTASAEPEEALYHVSYAQVQAAVQATCPTVSQQLTP